MPCGSYLQGILGHDKAKEVGHVPSMAWKQLLAALQCVAMEEVKRLRTAVQLHSETILNESAVSENLQHH